MAAGAGGALNCQKIIDKITARFDIAGLESLLGIEPNQEKLFYISLFKKGTNAPEIAFVSGNSFKPNKLYIVELQRAGFGSNISTKGAGLLLLDLVACYAAHQNMQLVFEALPSANSKSNNMGLYNFYNRAGMKASGPERVVGDSRSKSYSTKPNNLRTALASRYKGGRRRTRRRRRV